MDSWFIDYYDILLCKFISVDKLAEVVEKDELIEVIRLMSEKIKVFAW